jgi:dihydrolipoamide dehydrogenase
MELEATAEELAATIHAHPTLSEGLMEAALIIAGKPLHSL